jgi:hypothetical protein
MRIEPISVEWIRNLEVRGSSGDPMAFHAASGLVLREGSAFVVSDDGLYLGEFRLDASKGVDRTRRLFAGVLPTEAAERKRVKPDFETLFELTVGPGERPLLAVPSGSKSNRVRGAAVFSNRIQEVDFSELYARIVVSVTSLNVEGAIELRDSIYLFHRGNSAGSENAIIRLDRIEFVDDLGRGKITARCLRGILPIQLGEIDGVRLTFGDAAVDPLGRVWFLASAEATEDAYLDGEFRGAILGRFDASLDRIRETHRIGILAKPEGLGFDPGDPTVFYVVTDADDPQAVSGLFRGRTN